MTDPSMPPVEKPSKSKAASRPEFVFLWNETTHPITLLWREPDVKGPVAASSKILGLGLNWIRSDIPPKCTAPGETFGDLWQGRLRECDPATISQHVAVEVAKNTSSRQACLEWRKVETRPLVIKALEARLATRGPRKLASLVE